MTQLKELHPVTMAEFVAMEKQEHLTYELIDGVVMVSPRPAFKHQIISGHIYYELREALNGTNWEPLPEVDLIIQEQNFVPDLIVVYDDNLDQMIYYDKPPIIAIEIISPSRASRDYFVKRRAYQEVGVQEYWIVSPEEQCIMVISFATGEICRYGDGQVKSYVLPEIAIDLDAIFA